MKTPIAGMVVCGLMACDSLGADVAFTRDASISQGDAYDNVFMTCGNPIWVTMTGGDVFQAFAHGNTRFVQIGGLTLYLNSYEQTTVTFSGGRNGMLTAQGNSQVEITGGRPGFFWTDARDSSRIEIFGGEFNGTVRASHSGVLNIHGGVFEGDVSAMEEGSVNVYGGQYVALGSQGIIVSASDNSAINVHGRDFIYEPDAILLESSDFTVPPYLTGFLTGILQDGTPFRWIMADPNETISHVNLLPEPTVFTLIMVCLPLVPVCRKSR